MAEEDIEQTLHIARAVSVYRIPPRPGAQGWRSGEWLVSDKIFGGRLRIVSKGELCEVRLEDVNSGELFACCPVPYGQRTVCVEPVSDSSRYYVLRVSDAATGRHAFLGMGFDNRTDAFDFNEALVRHEQHVARECATRDRLAGSEGAAAPAASSSARPAAAGGGHGGGGGEFAGSASSSGTTAAAAAEVDLLYRHTADLKLGEGQTIRVNVAGLKKPAAAGGANGKGGFVHAGGGAGGSPNVPHLIPPPPLPPAHAPAAGHLPPPPQQQQQHLHLHPAPAAAAPAPPAGAPPATAAPPGDAGWATFD